MGVPLLYRWLTERYPLINRPASSLPHAEVDNLYIDANGILHNCTHGANKPPPKADGSPPSEADMMIAICSYLDSLVQLVRPMRLLYVAIDGVAPRAKMNQQRQRRFRVEREREEAAEAAALEAEAKRQKVEAARVAAAAQVCTAPTAKGGEDKPAATPAEEGAGAVMGDAAPDLEQLDPAPGFELRDAASGLEQHSDVAETELIAASSTAFDSNCVTPGTAFMSRCAEVRRDGPLPLSVLQRGSSLRSSATGLGGRPCVTFQTRHGEEGARRERAELPLLPFGATANRHDPRSPPLCPGPAGACLLHPAQGAERRTLAQPASDPLCRRCARGR
jgi:hypothetical protein